MRTNRTRLWTATAITCGLFLVEDPAVIAARQRLRGVDVTTARATAIDVGLAVVMLVYNVAAVRYVARVASAALIERAVTDLDDERARHQGRLAAVLRAVNPFELLKQLAGRVGAALERAGVAARRRGRRRAAQLLSDLALVNLLGVPGAGVRRATVGTSVTVGAAVRMSVLFVGSWFAGAWIIEGTLRVVRDWPVVGAATSAAWSAISNTYAAVTDVSEPWGACCVGAFAIVVVRYVRRVERRVRELAPTP